MDRTAGRAGSLIAIDGTRGKDIAAEAESIAEEFDKRGIRVGTSRWDGSGIFGDLLQAAPDERQISPRGLALAFAADLNFRLRWEIRPALAEGRVIVAVPYIDTVIGIGRAYGIPVNWLKEILRFADAPDASVRARERKRARGWKPRPERGFGEFCAVILGEGAAAGRKSRRIREEAADWLSTRGSRSAPLLTKKTLAAMADAATNSPKAAPDSSGSRPGSAPR